jgi:ethanolamine utilization microcompartment shell protein EutS
MAGFVMRVAPTIIRYGGPVVRETVRGTVRQTGRVIAPTKEFARGVIVGKARQTPLGFGGGTTQTISVSLRSGMQVRSVTKFVVQQTVVRGPMTVVRGVNAIGKTVVRDAVQYAKTPIHFYQSFRGSRVLKGQTSAIERVLDERIIRLGHALNRMGLNQSAIGSVGGLLRLPFYGGLVAEAIGKLEDARGYLSRMDGTIQQLQGTLRDSVNPVQSPAIGDTVIPSQHLPVSSQPIQPPPRPNVVPSGPVSTSRSGAPIATNPPYQRRK